MRYRGLAGYLAAVIGAAVAAALLAALVSQDTVWIVATSFGATLAVLLAPLLSWRERRRRCPQCRQRNDVHATACERCGAEFLAETE